MRRCNPRTGRLLRNDTRRCASRAANRDVVAGGGIRTSEKADTLLPELEKWARADRRYPPPQKPTTALREWTMVHSPNPNESGLAEWGGGDEHEAWEVDASGAFRGVVGGAGKREPHTDRQLRPAPNDRKVEKSWEDDLAEWRREPEKESLREWRSRPVKDKGVDTVWERTPRTPKGRGYKDLAAEGQVETSRLSRDGGKGAPAQFAKETPHPEPSERKEVTRLGGGERSRPQPVRTAEELEREFGGTSWAVQIAPPPGKTPPPPESKKPAGESANKSETTTFVLQIRKASQPEAQWTSFRSTIKKASRVVWGAGERRRQAIAGCYLNPAELFAKAQQPAAGAADPVPEDFVVKNTETVTAAMINKNTHDWLALHKARAEKNHTGRMEVLEAVVGVLAEILETNPEERNNPLKAVSALGEGTQELTLATSISILRREAREVTPESDSLDRQGALSIRGRYVNVRSAASKRSAGKQVLNDLENLRSKGVPVGVHTYRQVLKVLDQSNRSAAAAKVYTALRQEGVRPDASICIRMLSLLSRRSLREVYTVCLDMLDLRLAPVMRSIDHILHAVAYTTDRPPHEQDPSVKLQRCQEIITAALRAFSPSEETYLPLFGLVDSYATGVAVMELILASDVEVTPKTVQAMLDLAARHGEMHQLRRLLSLLPSREAPQWRALLVCHHATCDYSGAHETWREMVESGVEPSVHCYAVYLRILAELVEGGETEWVERGASLVSDAMKKYDGLQEATNLWNGVLQLYVLVKDEEAGRAHIQKMLAAGVPANSRCRVLYRQLTGHEMPDTEALSLIDNDKTAAKFLRLKYKITSRVKQRAVQRHPAAVRRYVKALENELDRLERKGCPLGAMSLTTCISLYGDVGRVDKSHQLFETVRGMSDITPKALSAAATAMMGAYTNRKDFQGIQQVWKMLREKGIQPSGVACGQLLWGMQKARMPLSEQIAVVKDMADAGIPLPEQGAVAMVTNAATSLEALSLLDTFSAMGFAPSLPLLGAGLKACAKSKDESAAEALFGRLAALGGPRGRDYVALMNVYKATGKLDRVLDIRAEMRSALPEEQATHAPVVACIIVETATCAALLCTDKTSEEARRIYHIGEAAYHEASSLSPTPPPAMLQRLRDAAGIKGSS